MQPLNPFLAAFFKSNLPSQCSNSTSHVLLVPTTDFLLQSRETNSASTADFIQSEDFLASHVIHIQTGGVVLGGRDGKDNVLQSMRESRGKPRSYNTINNRSVIIRENFLFTNKGFKATNEALILHDAIWYADNIDAKQWLIFYISKPLVGNWNTIPIQPAIYKEGMARKLNPKHRSAAARALAASIEAVENGDISRAGPSDVPPSINNMRRRKQIKTLQDLLVHFPAVAKHMQPGLEKLFNEFKHVFEKPLPPPPSSDDIPDPEPATQFEQAVNRTRANSGGSLRAKGVNVIEELAATANAPVSPPPVDNSLPVTENFYAEDDEDLMRASLETAISSAIDLFRTVDKSSMANIHNQTGFNFSDVEKLIERFVTEHVHHILFPRLCVLKRPYDKVLEAKIRQMACIDVSQLGVSIHGGPKGKHELVTQLGAAITEFQKLSEALSPHAMLELLLSTMKRATDLTESKTTKPGTPGEKPVLTVNADTLVSLLLFVVIRAQVRNLQARLIYIRNFLFLEDVDNGEMGYALSTFEAVLAYLSIDSTGLRRASQRNKALWDAVCYGDLESVRSIMEPSSKHQPSTINGLYDDMVDSRRNSLARSSTPNPLSRQSSMGEAPVYTVQPFSGGTSLAHVFPFSHQDSSADNEGSRMSDDDDDNLVEQDFMEDAAVTSKEKKVKRVVMDIQSNRSESEYSYQSMSTGDGTINSVMEGDISVDRLSHTHDAMGQSILMMSVLSGRDKVLRYLLSLSEYFPPEYVLADMNIENTTLLSSAIQLGNHDVIDVLLDYILINVENVEMEEYCALQDINGRSLGHYLIHAPQHINRMATLVPWDQKDKNGQTPLFSICRSYDQSDYRIMVNAALDAAQEYQNDGLPLHLDNHIDNRGNTLLHIVPDVILASRIMTQCDVDVNAVNIKHFTPLMVASKYGRYDMIRVLYSDPRVDSAAREARGFTAVELAKDEEVRSRIDDLALFAMMPNSDGRLTGVIRGFFVEDATIRLVVKTAAPAESPQDSLDGRTTYTVTTCRRSLLEFETLEKLLSLENPSSWLPLIAAARSPFQIHSKPSRAVLHDIQQRANWFIQLMLEHPTFATHEMLWEFFLVPELRLEQMQARSELKVQALMERIRDEIEPVRDVREVENFVDHARDSIRKISHRTRSVSRRVNGLVMAAADLSDSSIIFQRALETVYWLPESYQAAFQLYARAMTPREGNANTRLHSAFIALQATIDALLRSFNRPPALADKIRAAQRAMERNFNSIGKAPRWPLGIMDDARQRANDEREAKALKSREELLNLGRELRHCQQVVAGELAGWQDLHLKLVKRAMKDYARSMVIQEKERLAGLRRALRQIHKMQIEPLPLDPNEMETEVPEGNIDDGQVSGDKVYGGVTRWPINGKVSSVKNDLFGEEAGSDGGEGSSSSSALF